MTYTRSNKKRSIKFATSATLRIFNFELSEAERFACWYTQDEYTSFKTDVNITLALIAQNQDIDEAVHCRRGVACKLPENLKTKYLNRCKAWGAVLDEQDRQRTAVDGEYDVDAIAFAYIRHSYISRRTAYMIGMCDEKAARVLDSQVPVSPVVKIAESYDTTGNIFSRPSRTQKIILSPGRQVSSAIAA